MTRRESSQPFPGAGGSRFATTRWSLVAAAAQRPSPVSRQALATLCGAYWYPLYAYARRRGLSTDDAGDVTQSFFADLLEKGLLAVADRERGRFRAFILAAFQHFMAKEHRRATAKKRGGGRKAISLDLKAGEKRYLLEPAHDWTPERIYERRWALTLLERVMARLRQQQADAGKGRLFDTLKVFLTGGPGAPAYRTVAAGLGMSEGAVKVAVHRIRRKYRELLRHEVAQTVADPLDLEDELGLLLAALRGEKE